ncbi:MAG: transglycosylase domain-containing protein [Bacteroidota bacterium]
MMEAKETTPKKIDWKKRLKKWGIGLGIAFGAMLLSLLLFVLAVRAGVFGPIPDQETLQNIHNYQASEIYTADGKLLGRYYLENRTEVTFEELSPDLINALIATEDARFFEHDGVDMQALMRVAVKSILLQDKSSGGGSTISQQLAKNLFPREDHGLLSLPVSKVKEMIIAQRLEEIYSKKDILTMYFNTVPFGGNSFGIGTAARRFFDSSPKDIAPENAAVLVGMLKATTAYNPVRNPDAAQNRRNVVLQQMVSNGFLDPHLADSLQGVRLQTTPKQSEDVRGMAPYFRQEVSSRLKKWLAENPTETGETYNLFTDGLKIYTTLDSRAQKFAEKAVADHMKALQKTFDQHWKGKSLWETADPTIMREVQKSDRYQQLKNAGNSEAEILVELKKPTKMRLPSWNGPIEKEISPLDSIIYSQSFLHAGFLAMEPQSGHVRAWVGGINFDHFKYDHVTSRRQVGSTFKPFIYAAALADGYDPCEYVPNELVTYDDYESWSPGNADRDYQGYYSLQGGLANSVNTVSAAIMMKLGVKKAVAFAENFGFENLPKEPSIVLGTADLSLLDMAEGYSVFANRGMRAEPLFITRIEDADGDVIAEFGRESKPVRVLSKEQADIITHMLTTVVDSGTARRLRTRYKLSSQIGGKTGTTQDQTDGWFMGITPHLVAGAWVGGETRNVRFRSLALGQGANTALPIYAKFMQQYYADPKFRHTKTARFQSLNVEARKKLDCPMYTLNLEPERKIRLQRLIELLLKKQRDRKGTSGDGRNGKKKSFWDQVFQKKRKQKKR